VTDVDGGGMLAWLEGRTWEELEAIEHDGRLLFKDTLKKRDARGRVVEKAVRIRVPRQLERSRARSLARKWIVELGLDEEKDAHHFDAYETICLVACAVREDAVPHEQHMLHQDLAASCDVKTILELWDRVNFYDKLSQPRLGEVDAATFKAVVAAIARKGNLSPLVAIAGDTQDAFVVRMAEELMSSPTFSASSRSPATSTPASSTSSSSS
jgi:hypothetical protein